MTERSDAEVIALVAELDAKATKGSCPPMEHRLPLEEDEPDGYLESDQDFASHNTEWLEWCEENHAFIAAARTLLPDLANRLEAANRKSEWRPISEAPKDGTSILTFPHYHITHWDMEIESFTHGWDEDAERFKPMRWAPTHWMPLPTPPKDV